MRILLVEDEERLAASIARGLTAEGFTVDVVHDGAEGLWRAREGTFAAIVLDVMLPNLNGYQICRELRSDGDRTPILMLTAKEGEFDEAEAFDTGADDWVSKPFSFVVLVARLRSLVRRGATATASTATLEIGDLLIDPATRTCNRAGADIELTAREFDLIELLVRRQHEVVPRQELLDEVWGLEFDGDPNVLDVYISYLRRKIDKPFDRSTVTTVRGVGYRATA